MTTPPGPVLVGTEGGIIVFGSERLELRSVSAYHSPGHETARPGGVTLRQSGPVGHSPVGGPRGEGLGGPMPPS